MICTRLRPGHLSIRVGDGSRRSEEIVKKISNCAIQCDYHHHHHYYCYHYYYCICMCERESRVCVCMSQCVIDRVYLPLAFFLSLPPRLPVGRVSAPRTAPPRFVTRFRPGNRTGDFSQGARGPTVHPTPPPPNRGTFPYGPKMFLRLSRTQSHLFPGQPLGCTGVIALCARVPSCLRSVAD